MPNDPNEQAAPNEVHWTLPEDTATEIQEVKSVAASHGEDGPLITARVKLHLTISRDDIAKLPFGPAALAQLDEAQAQPELKKNRSKLVVELSWQNQVWGLTKGRRNVTFTAVPTGGAKFSTAAAEFAGVTLTIEGDVTEREFGSLGTLHEQTGVKLTTGTVVIVQGDAFEEDAEAVA